MRDKLVVVGNGPSLRGFDFRTLQGVDTLGMNAAYRHWDRIGWYPDLYACLDDELINTHWKQIQRLVETDCVKQAFLSGHFLKFVPQAANDPRYRFLDNYVEYWHETRGIAFGLERIHHSAFSTSAPEKLTTGSYAVRYGIACGYTRIALMGIDLKYIERIPEARSTGGIRLEIVETPHHNPNYFFDDYQRAGDAFQVPNPAAHHGQLHLDSFRALRDDAVLFNYDVEIVNTNLQSALHEEGVLPYQPLEVFLNRRVLGTAVIGAVVIPANARDIDATLENIWLWDQPAFAPFLHLRARDRPRLVYWFSSASAAVLEPTIATAFKNTRTLKQWFSDLEFRYERPNTELIDILKSASDVGRFIFYMETDCVPIRADWLGRLQDVVLNTEPFWMMGSVGEGRGDQRPLVPDLDGNAIYAVGDPQFQDFVAATASSDPTGRASAHKFRHTDIIRELPGGHLGSGPDLIRQSIREFPATYLIHGEGFAAVVHEFKRVSNLNDAIAVEKKRYYQQIVRETHDVVSRIIPPDATVLVISKGDNELLDLDGRPAWHFPRADDGAYAGFYPEDSAGAVGELEALRAKGAQFLLVPEPGLWWFSAYPGFKEHLDNKYARMETPDCCAIYRLGGSMPRD